MNVRLNYAIKNVFWSYMGTFVSCLLSFISRTVFIYSIGIDYLGINGLFTSVLGVLSLTELGFSVAMGYSLYQPAAENDIEKIKSLMKIYRTAYRIIAVVITLLGISILPFLHYIIKGGGGFEHIRIYYLIFLFNTVSSYFVSYKYSFVNARQQKYIVTNITTVFNFATTLLQIFVLVICKSYILYLLVQMFVQLVMKIYSSLYIDKLYPFLKDKDVKPLAAEEKKKIQKNIKALIIHKIGEVSVYQSSNIIISSFVSIAAVGLLSNYLFITNFFKIFINVFFSSLTGNIGNFIAVSSGADSYKMFRMLDLAGFILFGFSTICLYALVQPLILLLWGREYVMSDLFLSIYLFDFFLIGQRVAIQQVKLAGGIFVQDKFLPLVQAAVNLSVSIIAVRIWGINGVISGIAVSSLIPTLLRPYIVFKHLFKCAPWKYYVENFIRFCITTVTAVICFWVTQMIFRQNSWGLWILSVFTVAMIAVIVLSIYICLQPEAKTLKKIICTLVKERMHQRETA